MVGRSVVRWQCFGPGNKDANLVPEYLVQFRDIEDGLRRMRTALYV